VDIVLSGMEDGLRQDTHPLHALLLRLVEAAGTYRHARPVLCSRGC
jgi:hypothetical protein